MTLIFQKLKKSLSFENEIGFSWVEFLSSMSFIEINFEKMCGKEMRCVATGWF